MASPFTATNPIQASTITVLQTISAAAATSAAATSAVPEVEVPCDGGNGYDNSDLGVRISALFVILIGGMFGATFPVISKRQKGKALMPPVVFFIAKYFGSGVIIATAFIHLLAPAADALSSPCLSGPITEYDWAEGIALMTIFVLFFIELMIMRFGAFDDHRDVETGHGADAAVVGASKEPYTDNVAADPAARRGTHSSLVTPNRGEDHLGHREDHIDNSDDGKNVVQTQTARADDFGAIVDGVSHGSYDDYSAQMTAIFVLEFGIIFHSIFIGLTLAVTPPGDAFTTLYIVLVFHQTFEGLGLGTRLAVTPWAPTTKGRWTPYFLALGFALSTPIAMAIGLGVRETFAPTSPTALLTNGVFDSISAGILIYTGLVELMAHEFMFSKTMSTAKLPIMLSAFGVMCLGAGLMALLGKWA